MTRSTPLLALVLATALSGCHPKHSGNTLDAMDNELVNGSVTAEGNDSLRDAIRVDPARTGAGASSAGTASPAPAPAAMLAAAQQDCLKRFGPKLAYAKDWATKLPAELPLYPQARLAEAAGHDGGGCSIRVASFSAPLDRAALVDWYAEKARAGRYGTNRRSVGGDAYLWGSKGDASYTLIVGATKAGATAADLVWVQG